ncbi:hypothetical protein CO046_01950 [Candidatus Peregrinibacteria bacterium CG_4_9_14_0_2_um_filter_53_11]|nr:MAG: hypothetical protein CO046_01950 [Candidatus Peregrinibacteria bacterium CG_4_9_14_0_2_um_filter_53_11]
MAYIKRIISGLVGLALLSSTTAALAGAGALVNVTNATSAFNPQNGPAAISYTVSGGTASGVTINIYGLTNATGLAQSCNQDPRQLVDTIEGPVNRSARVQAYKANWDGKSRTGTSVPDGLYCYRLVWGGQPAGATPLRQGIIRVDRTIARASTPSRPKAPIVNGGGSGTGGSGGSRGTGGSGGTPSGGSNFCGGSLITSANLISASASTSTINPSVAGSGTVSITYRANQDLANGLALYIRDANGVDVATLFSTNDCIPRGTSVTKSWNGRDYHGSIVRAGNYTYEYLIPGRFGSIASGSIRVIDDNGGFSQANLTHYADPRVFDPTQGEITTIHYTVNRTIATGVTVEIRSGSPNGTLVKQLSATNRAVTPGAYSTNWNGRLGSTSTIVADGTYHYVFITNGVVFGNGTVEVRRGEVTPTPTPTTTMDVTNVHASPSIFNPTQVNSFLRFTLNQRARVTLTVRDLQTGATIRRLTTSQLFSSGQHSVTWNGRQTDGTYAPSATYQFTVSAESTTNATRDSETGIVTVTGTTSNQEAPIITNLGATPSQVNQGEISTIRFSVNQNARTDLTIFKDSTAVRHLLVAGNGNNAFANAIVSAPWNTTRDNGQLVETGTYTYIIEAQNSNGVAAAQSGTIIVGSSTPSQQLRITSNSVNPYEFNPEIENTEIHFTLNQNANVTITIRDTNGNLIERLTNEQFFGANTDQTATWSGTHGAYPFPAGTYVDDGTYTYKITATSATYGSDSVSGSVIVRRGQNAPGITINQIAPQPFDPVVHGLVSVDFTVVPTPTTLTARVYGLYGATGPSASVQNLNIVPFGSNHYRFQWNGRNPDGSIVLPGSYVFRIEANLNGRVNSQQGQILVGQSGVITPPRGLGDCGNFRDVSRNNQLCAAIDFVVDRGIFEGYPNGTLGLDNVIKRAEYLAVIQKAFGFDLEPYSAVQDGDLGYRDLRGLEAEWFMPYIKTFSRLGIMVGYPDGTMRPERTMSTAELYTSFLKAAQRAPFPIARYSIDPQVPFPPFADTPRHPDTEWYLLYAAFARLQGLVSGDYFYPARGITRGQVIELIYATHRKGLIRYPDPIAPTPLLPI